MSELRKLSRYICELSLDNVPNEVQNAAKLCVLDSVGAAVGAAHYELIKGVADTYYDIAGKSDHASCWGQKKKAPLLTAIFLNAMMGHTLELDDVHTNSKTHIGTVVVPTAWTMAEFLGRSGKEFLEAVICGYEVMSRIGMGFGVSGHRNKGWHVTATAGTFGAAAAAAKLLKLDEEKTVSALGMAGTQSFGLWAFLADGANCKVLHPARAAVSGAEAALLAKSNMTGPEHILDAKDGGLFAAMSDEHDISLVAKDLGQKYEMMYMDNKPYPCCRSTHCTIDAALAIKNEFGISKNDIEEIEVATYLVGYKQCGVSEGSINPVTPVDAKFSTPFTVACAFLFGEVTLNHFKQECIQNPEVRDLLRKVNVVTEDRFTKVYPGHWGCELSVTCKDGRIIKKEIADASGSVDNPLTKDQVRAKALALISDTCSEDAARIVEMILAIDDAQAVPAL
ncbi:MmgE/PrpD family protein [Petroclostridium sp. X23]|uniref:MmgE/PrpD family protein n=1 Tax=Petroclostridium sp. X23 TaxID=3045146 RepID=UPI0024ACCC54|nr:MmgE/PrpD family protein [Petroclostridium sp. X23]WHH61207.1 MmgE/PrpD family protein [Petroclostridium sp. X23]